MVELLHTISQVLHAPNVEIAEAPFDMLPERVAPGGFVYFDPPYAPAGATAGFRTPPQGSAKWITCGCSALR